MPAIARRTHLDWEEAYKAHGTELARFEEFVESYEKEHQLSLTPGAVELLFVPLIEILDSGDKLDFVQVTSTFKIVIQTMKEHPSKREKSEERSSLSVVKAFWNAWCNIPPFCDETKEQSAA
jgi:hypothetical protein